MPYSFSLHTIIVDENNPIYDSRDNCNAVIETATNTLVTGCYATIIPNSVEVIVKWAFFSVTFNAITIPEGVIQISVSAFADCLSLRSIVLPSTIEKIDENAFLGATALKTLYNLSALNIVAGSEEYGYVAYYATNVYTSLP